MTTALIDAVNAGTARFADLEIAMTTPLAARRIRGHQLITTGRGDTATGGCFCGEDLAATVGTGIDNLRAAYLEHKAAIAAQLDAGTKPDAATEPAAPLPAEQPAPVDANGPHAFRRNPDGGRCHDCGKTRSTKAHRTA